MKNLFRSSLAIGLAAAIVVAVLLVFQHSARLAFADVLENVRQVKSVKLKLNAVMQMGGQTITTEGIMYIDESNHRMRQEFHIPDGNIINVFDFTAGKGLTLMAGTTTATRLDVAHMPKEKAPQDMLARLQKLPDVHAKDLGVKAIGGRNLHGFLAVGENDETNTVWADEKTKMPIVVETNIRNGFVPMQLTMSDFDWNWPIDEALLKLEVPAGYTVVDAPLDMARPAESDVVAALKASVIFNGGKFPEGLTFRQLGQSMANSLADKSQVELKMRAQAGNLLVVAHGLAYIGDLQNGAGWRWAGADVPQGEKGRAILWYKPKGKATWRVFDADLSIHDEASEPEIPSTPVVIEPTTQPTTQP